VTGAHKGRPYEEACRLTRDGDAVICIHGLGGTSTTFQQQMAVLIGNG
jgi:hypothetical protein